MTQVRTVSPNRHFFKFPLNNLKSKTCPADTLVDLHQPCTEFAMEKAIRVLVANQPRLMRELILTTFADQPDIEIVGEVGEESEISESVKRTLPNFVVIALDHPGRRPAICDELLREYPEVRVIAVAPERN